MGQKFGSSADGLFAVLYIMSDEITGTFFCISFSRKNLLSVRSPSLKNVSNVKPLFSLISTIIQDVKMKGTMEMFLALNSSYNYAVKT